MLHQLENTSTIKQYWILYVSLVSPLGPESVLESASFMGEHKCLWICLESIFNRKKKPLTDLTCELNHEWRPFSWISSNRMSLVLANRLSFLKKKILFKLLDNLYKIILIIILMIVQQFAEPDTPEMSTAPCLSQEHLNLCTVSSVTSK